MVNESVGRVTVSCSMPMMIPLSMRTADESSEIVGSTLLETHTAGRNLNEY